VALVGESGVGKTAVVEGLAWAIVHEQVPDNLLDKKIPIGTVIIDAKWQKHFGTVSGG